MSAGRLPHPIEVLYGNGVALACGLDGQVRADELHGLFAGDTRVLSTYRLVIGAETWQLLGRQRSGQGICQWRFQSPAVRGPGGTIPEAALFLELNRRVAGALHDDIVVSSFARSVVHARLVVQLDADFADIFEIKEQSVPPRLAVSRIPQPDGLTLLYEHGRFRRALHVSLRADASAPQFVGSSIVFDLQLGHGDCWTCCIDAEPEIDDHRLSFAGDPHRTEEEELPEEAPRIAASPLLQAPFERGCKDLASLRVAEDSGPPYVAGGVPWFYTLFGRDSLVAALMSGLVGSGAALGALSALGKLQARERDDWRDAEPGKLPHEVRRGELAVLDRIPHACYYGTHDAPALYCLTLWNAWRWSGDRRLLEQHLSTAEAALRWCDEFGDRDDDGLQEYATRSAKGYYNQSWKDAGDAIVHADGRLAEVPLATLELQGYLYAARLAMAELLDEAGDATGARAQRAAAAALRRLVDECYWLHDLDFYAMALDGRKRPVMSIGSNAGQLLWTGLPESTRAEAVARRLLKPDLFSGWGLRTLSSDHPRYNPLSYQRGSVWPHDTVLAAAGLWRYGMQQEAAGLIRGVLEAASALEDDRLPELFCGFNRAPGPPVPYREANIPQAWAASAPILAAQVLLGLVPDAPRGRCFVAPWLPDWLDQLEARGIRIGDGRVDIVIRRDGEQTVIADVSSNAVEVVRNETAAPLWGNPIYAD